MRKVIAALILLFTACFTLAEAPKPASTAKPAVKSAASKEAAKETRKQYYAERKIIVEELRKKNDAKFLNLFRQDNLKKKVLRDKIVAKHPELAKIKDPAERQKAAQPFTQELKKSNDKDYQEYMKVRVELDRYLMSRSPKMKAAFEKMDPAFQDLYEPSKE